jgi:excinuclease ABC subunit C
MTDNLISLSKGIEVIKNELLTIPNKPGVYQMIGANEQSLYIGKAKNLNNRINFYTQPKRLNSRLTYMVSNTIRIRIHIRHTYKAAYIRHAPIQQQPDGCRHTYKAYI